MKQLIGIFRIIIALVLVYAFDIPLFDVDALKFWVSDMIHGSHSSDFRNTTSVSLTMLVILSTAVFYTIQSFVYIFLGDALEGKKTGLFRFVGLVLSGLRECANDRGFWTTDSGASDLSRINDLMTYRDNKMALMNNKDAAEFMSGTGHVEHMMNRPDLKQSRKALSYLNNKIAFMDNESALNFIKGQK